MNEEQIRELSRRVVESLAASGQPMEVMHLKFQLEVASSKLYVALGWMLRDGIVDLVSSEYGYRVALSQAASSKVSKETVTSA